MSEELHTHEFKPTTQQVLLGCYRIENGKMRYVSTTGKDILKQYKCKCGITETVDLERKIA